MSEIKKNIRKRLGHVLWLGIAILSIWLLVAAVSRQSNAVCKDIDIHIKGVRNNFFLDKQDVLKIIHSQNNSVTIGKPMSSINLQTIELELERNIWIDNAELFFDNNNILHVELEEREPVARIFSNNGNSFYIDHRIKILPLSDKFSARLPVFTGFEGNTEAASAKDSALLLDIRDLSVEIYNDSFMMAMIDQVDIRPNQQFDFIPKIGRQIIEFGNVESITEKFEKLKLFYKQVIPKSGWSKYSVISLQYTGQVVAKQRDKAEVIADSLRALELLEAQAAKAAEEAGKTGEHMIPESKLKANDGSMIEKSMQRDDDNLAEPYIPESVEPSAPAIVNPVPASENAEQSKPVNTIRPVENRKTESKLTPKSVEQREVQKPKPKPPEKKSPAENRVPKAVMGGN